jgi:uncharacterized protein YbbC (DUF1343 family)
MEFMKKAAPSWMDGCILRPCWFEPTFHKHVGKLCEGIQIHTDGPHYLPESFKPWRVQALMLKAIRCLCHDYGLWRDFPYEYENDRLAIDLINGGPRLRAWVDDKGALPCDLDKLALQDEREWEEERESAIIYR